jgi:hypothetical protein
MRKLDAPLRHPPELKELMAASLWPSSHVEAIQQNCVRRISVERIHLLMPTENQIFLYPNPIMTIAADHEAARKRIGETEFFAAYDRTLSPIDPDRALFIADFGAGSDAPIAMDFRGAPEDPPILGLKWDDAGLAQGNHPWIQLAPRFSDFVSVLDLWNLPKFRR